MIKILSQRSILICSLGGLCTLAQASPAAFEQVKAQLSKDTAISGDFKQIRHMKLLSSPAVSTGHFTLSQSKGLTWQQVTPFKSTMRVTAHSISQTFPGMPPTVITQDQQPVVFSFTRVFLSTFQGNLNQIQQTFKLKFSGTTSAWSLTLTPKSSPINKVIRSIVLSGGRYITQVIVNDTQANTMTLLFSKIRSQTS
ncbi:MAG: hypothetical protein COV52_10220 [Gammaproteobacteria bacterium CG11_big_fil_rev_8_21_14_0_20_46_22]|nr:MAG: hypothetical protein COW05_09445 [Gammaproteobacteria bacterium CG12_big_fil_rev_8_21_14_0_65_46_12]PIR10072.1 MAG: hypothetical protein COV52_10220 [Gammaproteobacteria bacterium CG11_big_fil_rev_8_21_14_0_20_46_22]